MSTIVETVTDNNIFQFRLEIHDAASAGVGAAALTEQIDPFFRRHALSNAETAALQTAIEELLVNIGAYGSTDGGEIREIRHCQGEVRVEHARLVFIINDDAPPFDPRERPKPDLAAPLEKRRIGGLGLHMLFSYFDAMEYAYRNGRNVGRWILQREKQERTGT